MKTPTKPLKPRRTEKTAGNGNRFQKALVFLFLLGIFAYLASGDNQQAEQAPTIPAVLNETGDQRAAALKPEIKNVRITYYNNSSSGKSALLTGRVHNSSNKTLVKVQLKAIMQKDNKTIRQSEVYAGRRLVQGNLQSWSTHKINDYLNKPYHDDSSRLITLAPGASLPFMVVFGSVQDEMRDYKLEIINWQEN